MEIKSLEDAYKMAYRDGQLQVVDSILKVLALDPDDPVKLEDLFITLKLARERLEPEV